MSTGGQRRTRSERVAALELPPGWFGQQLDRLQQGDVVLRLALCLLTAVVLWAVTGAWAPPFPYQEGDIPARNIVARVDFEVVDPAATLDARERARNLARAIYIQDPDPWRQLRASLQINVDKVLTAKTLDELDSKDVWLKFEPAVVEAAAAPEAANAETAPTPEALGLTDEDLTANFNSFREALLGEGALEAFHNGLAEAFTPLEQRGMMIQLPEEHVGNQEKILVRQQGTTGLDLEVDVANVLEAGARATLQKNLSEKLAQPEVAERAFTWLKPQVEPTLKIDIAATQLAADKAADEVEDVKKLYPAGGPEPLAIAGEPINAKQLELLRNEYRTELEQRSLTSSINRSLAALGMYIALYTLCGFYVINHAPLILSSLQRFLSLLAFVVATVALCLVASKWNAEMIPLLLFSMTIAIAYHQVLALLLSAAVALVTVLSIGRGIDEIVTLIAGVAATILFLKTVRTRSKLLYVGIWTAGVVLLTTIGVGTMVDSFDFRVLVLSGLRQGLWAIIAGSLMTCLLPFIERAFDVQTDISLIELGDPAHPLLQELIRRAPGTYNHSITVASLAEAAAEAIGARSLLVRVGAYFHDIGKMLKPGYFIENQSSGDNRHESLVPAMSTLVIIAHVKDGADLARQHHLPEPIIDFILQHHGTTLVEYFYRRASEQSENDGNDVDESAFRYPGPKPQTKEAGILMLSDIVESASRVLVEPTPSRIENLVEDLVMKRLTDGQFDECGLTFKEVNLIKESLVKSLTAVYHGRVKYRDTQPA
ncbi:MAG: HDIG domain-containing protein [Planctomycetales bacterium]|nr:HDIG domain-containing protein [Planctomycetales bacterium]